MMLLAAKQLIIHVYDFVCARCIGPYLAWVVRLQLIAHVSKSILVRATHLQTLMLFLSNTFAVILNKESTCFTELQNTEALRHWLINH